MSRGSISSRRFRCCFRVMCCEEVPEHACRPGEVHFVGALARIKGCPRCRSTLRGLDPRRPLRNLAFVPDVYVCDEPAWGFLITS